MYSTIMNHMKTKNSFEVLTAIMLVMFAATVTTDQIL
jgi:hypothetical protein